MIYKNSSPVPELLAPAGDMERLCAAIQFGADAVYLAGQLFGMRTAPSNFSDEELAEAVRYAHEHHVRVYVTINTLPHNEELPLLPQFLKTAAQCGADAFIISDLGVLQMAKEAAPEVEIHISTQAGVVNYAAANAFYELGASRVVLARELSIPEIAEIRAKTPPALSLEAFVHGSMCVSFSGRCLLSSYLTGRDANRGDCAQPCRWKYNLAEEKRPGEFMPVYEEDGGTYILNSKDLNMIEHLKELYDAGVSSMKIEGRAKSAYYVAVTTNAYRHAIDGMVQSGDNYRPEAWITEELNKISHRPYTKGFYYGNEPGQATESGGYVRDYEVVAVCEESKDGMLRLSQRNRFFKGVTVDVLEPKGQPYLLTLDEIFDKDMNPIDSAPHAAMTVYAKCDKSVAPGALLRRKFES